MTTGNGYPLTPEFMTPGEINKELDRLDRQASKVCDQFIAAGRGHERPSEYLKKDDPLSLEAKRISDRQHQLRVEIARRYGPGAPSRLPRGFKGQKPDKGRLICWPTGTPEYIPDEYVEMLKDAVKVKDYDKRCPACRRNVLHGYTQHQAAIRKARR